MGCFFVRLDRCNAGIADLHQKTATEAGTTTAKKKKTSGLAGARCQTLPLPRLRFQFLAGMSHPTSTKTKAREEKEKEERTRRTRKPHRQV